MTRTYTEAVNAAIRERTPLWRVQWDVALEKDEVRRIAIDGFEFTVHANSHHAPTLDRGRVVSDDRVGRLYLPGWADPKNPIIWSYVYVSTAATAPTSSGLGTPTSMVQTFFDKSVSHTYSKEGATGDAWLGDIQILAIGDQSENTLITEFGRKGQNDRMLLTLLMALLAFILADDGTKEGRRKALLTAGVVGAGTALVTTQTEWGRSANGKFNEAFGLNDSWTGLAGGSKDTAGATPTTRPQPTNGGSPSGVGIFSKPPTWTGVAGAGVAGLALGSTIPKWVWLVAGGLLIYSLLK